MGKWDLKGFNKNLLGKVWRVDLQPVLHVLGALAVELAVRVLEHVVSPHMHGHVLLPQALVQTLQLLPEVSGGRKDERRP